MMHWLDFVLGLALGAFVGVWLLYIRASIR
jgi:hypothetical protein